MISDAKQRANAANAQRSTGPRTPEGKARVGRNATTHGMFSRQLVLPGESPRELDALSDALWDAHDPCGTIEEMLLERIVADTWRLRRLLRVEAMLTEGARRELEAGGAAAWATEGADARKAVGQLERIGRYVGRVQRSLDGARRELRVQQAERMGEDAPRAGTRSGGTPDRGMPANGTPAGGATETGPRAADAAGRSAPPPLGVSAPTPPVKAAPSAALAKAAPSAALAPVRPVPFGGRAKAATLRAVPAPARPLRPEVADLLNTVLDEVLARP